jgi:hypothetical protein
MTGVTSSTRRLTKLSLILCVATCAVLWCSAVNAQLRAALSSNVIEELDSVQLVVRDLGTRQSETPDLSALEPDFHVLGVNTSSQYRFVNGRAQSWVDYQITLQPKRTGELLIPPIRIGQQQTDTLRLSVRQLSAQMRQKVASLVFYELELSSESIYVQSQLLLTRRLVYADGVQLFGGQLEKPELPGAQVIELGEGRSSVVQRNSQSYGSFEQRYAIFPAQSGLLTIPSDSVTASVRVLDGISTSRKTVRVSTEQKRITVKPIPPEYPVEKPWLPAIAITATQRFEPSLIKDFGVGDTLQRTVDIRVIGNSGASLPPIKLALPDTQFKSYPQPTQISDNAIGDNLVGSRVETLDIVPIVPGALGLPGTDITWWNTDTESLMTTSLDDRALIVVGDAIATIQPSTPATQSTEPVEAAQLGGTIRTDSYSLTLWRGLIAIFVLAVIVALWRRRSGRSHKPERSSPMTAQASERVSQRAPSLKALAAAAKNAPPGVLRQQLGLYLCAITAMPTGPALEAFRHSSATAYNLVAALDATCYGNRTLTDEQRGNMARALKYFAQTQKTAAKSKTPPLPPLYSS